MARPMSRHGSFALELGISKRQLRAMGGEDRLRAMSAEARTLVVNQARRLRLAAAVSHNPSVLPIGKGDINAAPSPTSNVPPEILVGVRTATDDEVAKGFLIEEEVVTNARPQDCTGIAANEANAVSASVVVKVQ